MLGRRPGAARDIEAALSAWVEGGERKGEGRLVGICMEFTEGAGGLTGPGVGAGGRGV